MNFIDRINFRKATLADRQALWQIIQPVIRQGGTYVFSPDSDEEKMMGYWLGSDKQTYVAEIEGKIVGTFYIKENQPDLGNHVCNAGFIVDPNTAGQGIGRQMGLFALSEAKRLGYQAMQFNFVVSTNSHAVHLWQSLGFQIIGEVPDAYRYPERGMVSALVMYQKL
ncbi:GNAT family N-acetyltransferase [Mariniradius sediminis]|uniref:GNAT family N-acetyltransferase n=1 Tax=Mariniradius sediminis TaxID=2909237 RepID=A0ABS9BTY6_9BACT|nr:GNAT family N-acetyltransferase [Mariniradius sediminis]MCF1751162.1 GNAT family N-acetyltransferase [Mariniradius sediminis]